MAEPSGKTVFVNNINYKTDGQGLAGGFTQFGELANVRIITRPIGRDERESLGFGFIEFKTVEAFEKAVNYKGDITVDGRRVIVRPARPPQRRKRDTAFIAGIPEGTTDDHLKQAFAKYNPVTIKIVRHDGPTGKGFAFVTFDTEEHQTEAVTNNRRIQLNGSESAVAFARPRSRFSRFGRRPFRGGGGGPPRRAPRATPRPAEGDAAPAGQGTGAAGERRPRRARRGGRGGGGGGGQRTDGAPPPEAK